LKTTRIGNTRCNVHDDVNNCRRSSTKVERNRSIVWWCPLWSQKTWAKLDLNLKIWSCVDYLACCWSSNWIVYDSS